MFPVLLSAGLLAAGIALFYASTLPYDYFRSLIYSLGLGNFSSYLTPSLYASVIVRLRLAGAGLACGAACVFLLRNRIQTLISSLAISAGVLLEDWKRAVRGESRAHLWALAAMTGFGIWARVSFLTQPIRNDESYTFLFFASKPIFFGLSVYHDPNNHVFHTLLMHLAYLCFGDQPWAIRLPASIAGILMVPVAYATARVLVGGTAALLTAALVASSSLEIEYSTNGRGYTMVCLFFLTGVIATRYAIEKSNAAGWAVFALASGLGFYTIPTMLYPFGSTLLWVAFSGRVPWKRCATASAAALGIAFVLYIPVLAVSGISMLVANKYIGPLPWPEFLAHTRAMLLSTWGLWNRDLPAVLRWLLEVGFVAGQVLLIRGARPALLLPGAALLFCSLTLVTQRAGVYERMWLFLLPVYLLASVAGLLLLAPRGMAPPKWLAPVAAAVLCAWLTTQVVRSRSILQSEQTGVLPEAEKIVEVLKDRLGGDDAVYASPIAKITMQYYFRLHGIPDGFLYRESAPGGRRFVVVHHLYGDTLESVLREFKTDPAAVWDKRLLGQFGPADLYEIRVR